MKKTITVLKITALVLAVLALALALYAYVWERETPEMQTVPAAQLTEPAETINSDDLPEPTAIRAKITGEPQIYWREPLKTSLLRFDRIFCSNNAY